jgi:hypothetical protein
MPPQSLSDRSEAVAERAQGAAAGVERGCPAPPRRASAPEKTPEQEPQPELELPEAGAETSDSHASLSSSQEVGLRKSKSSGDATSPSPRVSSRHSSPSSSSEVEDPGKALETSGRVKERRSASLLRGARHGQGQGQGQGKTPTRSRSRSRSQGLARKMAKTGLKRREVVAEGIRSWFR